jgi:YidC/Oxa1 family membrane protein insertase
MENRALIALGLSFVIFLAFIYFGDHFKKPVPIQGPAPIVEKTAPQAAAPEAAAKPPVRPQPVARPLRDVVVETPLFKAVFTELGGRLKSFQLLKYQDILPIDTATSLKLGPVDFEVQHYKKGEEAKPKPKELVRPGNSQELPLAVGWEGKQLSVSGVLPCEASASQVLLKPGEKGTLQFKCISPEGVAFTKTYTFNSDNYDFGLAVKVANHTKQTLEGAVGLELSENFAGEEASRFHFLGFNGSIDKHWEEIKSGSLKDVRTFSGKVGWAGLDEGYFMIAAIPDAPQASVTLSEKAKEPMTALVKAPMETVPPGQERQVAYTLYFGPKDLSNLKPLGMDGALNFGWFDFLGKPLLAFLKWIHGFVPNYGWAIIVLTFLIRIVFIYPNHKSYKSMKDMQKLQPKVAKIREKYKEDKEAMNKELMALYRTFKVNPMAGCLPMVLQLPVFISLYNVLGYSIELRHASFIPTLPFTDIVWLADLSAKDPLLITPIVMGATMFLQQKMTPSAGDPTQAKLMMFLPLIFTFMFLNFASGLVVYWLVNNVLSIIQQHYTNKYLT